MNKSRIALLENRILRIENAIKSRILEAKQVGTLYHVCTLQAYLKYILPKDQLVASGKYYNYVYGGDNYVSFTRDKYFVLDSRDEDIVLIQLVVDGDKLSENYKIGPYNDFAFDEEGELKDYDNPKEREMEEVAKGPIKNLSKYIKEVRFDIASSHDLTKEKDLLLLKKNKNALGNLVYYKFLRNHSANIGVNNGASFNEAMEALENWKSIEGLQEDLFSYSNAKIKRAINAGANVNKKHDADGYPLVFYCEDDENLPIIKTLLKAGANPNVVQDGMPVLCYAIDNWCSDIAETLIKANADVNAVDSDGMTSLMHAVYSGGDDLVELLVNRGVDVNAKNKVGDTALIMASKDGNIDLINVLLSLGADISATNRAGETALSAAKNKKTAAVLKKAGAV